MTTNKWLLLFFTSALMISCAKKPVSKTFQEAPKELGPNTADIQLDRSSVSRKSAKELLGRPAGMAYLNNTEEILELSETLYDLAELEKDTTKKSELLRFADLIHSSFYKSESNYTSFDHTSSTFLELALGIAYEGKLSLKDVVNKHLDEQAVRLETAIHNIKFELKPQKTKYPDIIRTIVLYEEFLRTLPGVLKSAKMDAEIVTHVEARLKNEYLPLLKDAREKLQNININNHPSRNLAIIDLVIRDFKLLPPSLIEPTLNKIAPVKDLVSKVTLAKSGEDFFDVFFELWDNPYVDRLEIREASKSLYDFLNSMTPEQIKWLKEYNLKIAKQKESPWWKKSFDQWSLNFDKAEKTLSEFSADPLVLTFKLAAAKLVLKYQGYDEVRKLLYLKLNSGISRQFDIELRTFSKDLVRVLGETLTSAIHAKFAEIRKDMKRVLRDEAQQNLFDRVFAEKPSFVAIEDSHVELLMNKDFQFVTQKTKSSLKPTLNSNKTITSARTIGLSLSLQAKRLALMDRQQNLDKTSRTFYEEVFVPVNKMMAIVGFKYMESEKPRFSGLLRKIQGPVDTSELNFENFDQEAGFFAVPEAAVFSRGFLLDQQETDKAGLESTVAGSAEIARGAGLMAIYLRDWLENSFDVGLGREEYKGVKIFPKDSLYALSIGVGSVPFRNLKRNGMMGISLSGKIKNSLQMTTELESNKGQCMPPLSSDPISALALVGVNPKSTADIVKSADLARFILASDVYYKALEEIERTQSLQIHEAKSGETKVLDTMVCARKQLKLLILGVANFLTSRMQLKDGGFAHMFSLRLNQIIPDLSAKGSSEIPNRYLEDQLLVIQALKKVVERWGGQAYGNLAVDAYHFMNSKLFDSQHGFYKSSLGSIKSSDTNLRLMAMTVETLIALESLVPSQDKDQLEFLTKTWKLKITDFGRLAH